MPGVSIQFQCNSSFLPLWKTGSAIIVRSETIKTVKNNNNDYDDDDDNELSPVEGSGGIVKLDLIGAEYHVKIPHASASACG